MTILLYPTRRDLATEVVKGPVVIIERFVDSAGVEAHFTSVYANLRVLDRKQFATLQDAVTNAIERDRNNVRLNKPASFNPPDAARAALDAGLAHGIPTAPPDDLEQ